jgi:hypothetical protein
MHNVIIAILISVDCRRVLQYGLPYLCLLRSDKAKGKTERPKQGNGESTSKAECSFYLHIKGNLYFSPEEIL